MFERSNIPNMPTPSKSDLKKRLSALEQERSLLRKKIAQWDENQGEDGLQWQAADDAKTEVYILDKAADGIFTLDEGGRVCYINPAGSRMLGLEPNALKGQKIVDVLGRDGHDEWATKIGEWIQDPHKLSPQLWLEISSKNILGTQRWLSLNLSWNGNAQNAREVVHGIIRDVTDQKRLEIALRQSEEHYRGIIENMDLGILEVDTEERITRAFPKFCAIVGYTEEELLGRKASEVFMVTSERERMEARTEARNKGESELYECSIRNKNGELVWLLISGVPLRNEAGQSVGSMGIHYNITERKKNEERLQKAMLVANAARAAERRFLAKMSHEIRTPLNAIIGMSHILEDTPLSEEQSKFVNAISKGGVLLKELLDSVLDIARLEEGRKELNMRSTTLRPIFDGIMVVYKPLMINKGISLELEWDGALDGSFKLDVQALSQVLLNLVGNAAKFTEAGSIRLRPSLLVDGRQLRLKVEVSDSGRGIAPEHVNRVFDRFAQVKDKSDKLQDGSGLGLAICKELCRLHGGNITLVSELEKGSAFTFEFAIERGEATVEISKERAQDSVRSLRILCAEDNTVNLMYLSRILKEWGVTFEAVSNGADAVALWREKDWDVILMDIQMPIMGGIEASRIIRDEEKNRDGRTTIVGLSAFAFESDEREGLEAGMDAYLKKPYSPIELLEVLQRYIKQ